MWLVSCRRQGMLTIGPAQNRRGELIISSFLTLPSLLYYLICNRNVMFVLLLQMARGGIGRGWLIYIRMSMWWQGTSIVLYFLYSFCTFVFCSLIFSVYYSIWCENDNFQVFFFDSYAFNPNLGEFFGVYFAGE